MTNTKNLNSDTLPASWGILRVNAGCTKCNRSFLISESDVNASCPICFQGKLTQEPSFFRAEPPERIIPIVIDAKRAVPLLDRFVNEVKLRCDDFSTQQMSSRMRLFYLPMWLVDATLSGHWDANAGFPQQVKSSVEKFSNGSWVSQGIIETKLFWEKRVGEISRRYENIAVPSSTDFENITSCLDEYDLNQSLSYSPSLPSNAIISVPNIEPDNAWHNARPLFEKQARNDVLIACGANEIRDYQLTPVFEDLNWTQILLPILSTYYLDDDGQPQIILINAQTGKIWGKRIASQRKGFLYASIAFAIALTTFFLGLGAFALAPIIPPVSFLGLLFIPIAIIATIVAVYFMILPWRWNQAQNQKDS